jgi:hypothetical protein
MSSPCFSHRPAGLIPFEIRQPVPPRVKAATKFSTYRFIDVLFVFYKHSPIVMSNMWPIPLSLEARSLDKPLMLIMFFPMQLPQGLAEGQILAEMTNTWPPFVRLIWIG